MAWYLESTKAPGLKFRILQLDKSTMHAHLLGETGVPFERVITQDVLDKYGFEIRRAAVPVAECAPT